ncbi:trigger factor [Brachybacterium nesterenkovii]|uniref:Trigger factor n=1 Tax=Brachybacterium nesterenkovii TaxID=47847 RepID=A0A1X6WT37_9MICO|nr:trigger factor [Brachybacterium nesterenkovii]SLM88099.1 Cell division trigger factor [Brachybacterium nesterenkovii]
MKTAVEKLSPTRVKLNVEVPFAELTPAIEQATKKIADQVQIPGFRKGRVPSRLVEQRFGRPAIMQEAVNDALPEFYQQAALEAEIRPVGRPEVEITDVPGLDGKDEGDLKFVVEQDVRPEIELPDLSTIEVEIEEPAVDDDAVQVRLDALRERFGTLVGVDRPAADGDFVSLDMVATIDGEEIETVEGVSYRIGEGTMLDGLDEALIGLSAGETTTFTSELAGGDRAGEKADVKVTPQSVKVRELPEADDEFAELASEFDTIDELKADLKVQAERDAEGNRVALARNAFLEKILEELDIPVPESLVAEEISAHLQNEGKPEGDPHGEEIREDTERAIRTQFLLDALLETREVEVGQEDLMNYMAQLSATYGMDPNQFIQMLAQSGQIEAVFAEAQRAKALDVALADVTVKNASGDVIDLGLEGSSSEEDAEAPAEEKAPAKKAPAKKAPAKKAPARKPATKKTTAAAAKSEDAAEAPAEDAAAAADEAPAAKAPAKKAPARKPAAKKTTAAAKSEDAAEATEAAAEEEPAKKAPAKKAPAKKAPAKKAPARKPAAKKTTAAAEDSTES